MPRTEQARPIAVASPPSPSDLPTVSPSPSPTADGPPESLDKVRDILFGGQMRAVEARIQNLEERLLHEQEVMRTELLQHIREIDANARRELESLGARLATERETRAEELKTLGAELRESLRALERRHAKLEESANAADAELRDGLLEHSRATAAEFERLTKRVAADLDREVRGLRHDKLDVSEMAGVFSEMVSRLGGEPRAPAKGAARS
jgi:DNA anti-recombination protein RmuC